MTATPSAVLAEAACWRLLGLLFERPRSGWREELLSLAGELDDADLAAVAAATAAAAREGEYMALVGPGGPASPREVAYRGLRDPGRLLSDLALAYEAFAFRPRAEDPLDHVAVEAGFVGYLLLKEAYALALEDADAAESSCAAREGFVAEHLAVIAAPFLQRLEAAGESYLIAPARLLAARVPAPPPGAWLPGAGEDDEACVTCPMG